MANKGIILGVRKDLTGLKVGRLEVIGLDSIREDSSGKKTSWWMCKCSCGNQLAVRGYCLTGKKPQQSCGCILKEQDDYSHLRGQKFGRLTVVARIENNKHNHVMMDCVCECGNAVKVALLHLKSGHTKSCGCFAEESRKIQDIERDYTSYLGQSINGWTVIEECKTRNRSGISVRKVIVQCDGCGETVTRNTSCFMNYSPVCPKCAVKQLEERIKSKCSEYGDEFIGFMDSKPSMKSKLILRCPIHGDWNTTSAAKYLLSNRRCPLCAKTGFNSTKPAVVYVMKLFSSSGDYTGYGISNSFKTRLNNHKLSFKDHGVTYDSVKVFEFKCGAKALEIEKLLKSNFELNKTKITGFITENTTIENYEKVVNFIEEFYYENS